MFEEGQTLKAMGITGGLYPEPERITLLFVSVEGGSVIGHCLECGFTTKGVDQVGIEGKLLGFVREQLKRAYQENDFTRVTLCRDRDFNKVPGELLTAARYESAKIIIDATEIPLLRVHHLHLLSARGNSA